MDETKNSLASDVFSAAQREERDLTRKANHLSDFGTLTSLGSTAFYILEREVWGDKFPKPVNLALLGAMTVGIGAVIYGFHLRHKAGKVALENDRRMAQANNNQVFGR